MICYLINSSARCLMNQSVSHPYSQPVGWKVNQLSKQSVTLLSQIIDQSVT